MIDKITFLHFLTAALVIETFMLYLFRFTKSPFTGIAINRWYNNIGIVAVLLDVLSFIIGFYLAKFLYEYLSYHKYITDKYQFWTFLGLVLFIQILHDFGFYFTIIKNTNYGKNIVIDEFKRYAQSVSYGAVIGDSFMYLVATPILYYIITKKTNDLNIFVSLICSYLIGYFLYQKPIIKM